MINNVGWNRFSTNSATYRQQVTSTHHTSTAHNTKSKQDVRNSSENQQVQHAASIMQRIQQILHSIQQLNSVAQTQYQQKKQAGQSTLEIIRRAPSDTATAMQLIAQFASYGQQHVAAQQEIAGATRDPIDVIGTMAQKYTLGQLEREALQAVATELNIPIADLSIEAGLEAVITEVIGDDLASSLGIGIKNSAGTASATTATSSLGSTFNSVMGAAGAVYSAYNLINNFGEYDLVSGAVNGAAVGAQIGSFIPGVGTAIGAAVGGIIGGISSFFGGSGKSKEQKARDAVRDYLQENAIIDQDWALTLADGSRYSIGIDGKNKYENYDGTFRHPYDVDFSHPLAAQTVAWANPLFEVLLGDKPDLKVQFTGYFVNAALSNATDLETARQNLIAMISKFEVSPEELMQGLVAKAEQGLIDEQTLMIHINNIQTLIIPTDYEGGRPNEHLEDTRLVLINQEEAFTDKGERYFYGIVDQTQTNSHLEQVPQDDEYQQEKYQEEAA